MTQRLQRANRAISSGGFQIFRPLGTSSRIFLAKGDRECVCGIKAEASRTLKPLRRFGSALEGNTATYCRIRNAIAAVFHVASKPIVECRISGHGHNQVVPAVELTQDH